MSISLGGSVGRQLNARTNGDAPRTHTASRARSYWRRPKSRRSVEQSLGAAAVESLEARQLLAIDFAPPSPVLPWGTLAYQSQVVSAVTAEEPTVLIGFDVKASEGFSLAIESTDVLQPAIRVLNSEGTELLATAAAQASDVVVAPWLSPGRGHYQLEVSGVGGSTGGFVASLLLNSEQELETIAGQQNDDPASAQLIHTQSLNYSSVAVGTVIGTADFLSTEPFVQDDNFETGALGDAWSALSNTGAGQVVVRPDNPGEGQQSLVLEVGDAQGPRNEPAADVAYLYYDPLTGELSLDTTTPLTTLEIVSQLHIFTGDAAQNVGESPFDVDRDDKIFRLDANGYTDFTLGNVAQPGLTLSQLNQDLRVRGSWLNGGGANIAVLMANETSNTVTWQVAETIRPQKLSFMYRNVGDAPDALPAEFLAAVGDGVAISSDNGQSWTTVFTPTGSTEWSEHTIDLSSYSQAAVNPLLIRMQQNAAPGGDVESQAYDQIRIEGDSYSGGDWYRVEVGQSWRLSASAVSADGSPLKLDLYDAKGEHLARHADSLDGKAQTISGYRDRLVEVHDLLLRVSGADGVPYTLSVARNAEFDFGMFDDDVFTTTNVVVGHLEQQEVDDFAAQVNYTYAVALIGLEPDGTGNDLVPVLSGLDIDGNQILNGSQLPSGLPQLQVRNANVKVVRVASQGTSGDYALRHNNQLFLGGTFASLTLGQDLATLRLQFPRTIREGNVSVQMDGVDVEDQAITRVDGRTLEVTLATSLSDGRHVVSYSVPDLGDVAMQGESQFVVDLSGPRVISSSVAPNGVVVAGATTINLQFDDPLALAGISADTVKLVGEVTGVIELSQLSLVADNRLQINVANLPVDRYTLTLTSGVDAVRNQSGLPLDGELGADPNPLPSGNAESGGDFVISFRAVPALRSIPWSNLSPFAVLNRAASVSGVLASGSDRHLYKLPGTAGQRLYFDFDRMTLPGMVIEIQHASGEVVTTIPATPRTQQLVDLPNDAAGYVMELHADEVSQLTYQFELLLNTQPWAASDSEAFDTAQSLDDAFVSLPFDAELATVRLNVVPEPSLIHEFTFEDGKLPDGWTSSSTPDSPGVGVRVSNEIAETEGFAIVMDGVSLNGGGELQTNADVGIVYDPLTGNLSTYVPSAQITVLEILSAHR
ncbi:MAG: hypothetical protein KDA92_11370, partial [Planctomycetales bacterium]|nr:hypothetical protein [Planctomycetales bacterium]